MKKEWEFKELAAVSAINYGYTDSASNDPIGPRFLRITDIQDDRVDWKSVPYCKIESPDLSRYRLASGDIVFARTGATTGKSFLVNDPPDAVFASYLIRLRLLDKKLLPEFVSYFFQTGGYWQSIKDGSSGSAQGGFNASKLGALTIPVPPLAEQQRLVGILDEAFAGIATAKANAEKNLQNAHALFESHLQSVFTIRDDEVPLSALAAEITDGDHSPPPKAPTGIPFITISDIDKRTREVDFTNTFRVPVEYFQKLKPNKKPLIGDVLYTVTGATLGIPILVRVQRDFCFQRHIGLIRPKPDTDSAWLTYALLSPQVFRQATVGSTGAAQKTVSLSVLRRLKLPKVSFAAQKHAASQLDAICAETERLASLYECKLAALEALKKSLLHQAFSGELTKEPSQPVIAPLVPLLPPIPNLTPIELHAGILAMGYQAYEVANRQWHFGHVMAEKYSHMTEAMVGLDLGRKPVQDHFGPDDFPHFHKVEHRARKANYFTFQKSGKGHVFVKGRGFESLVAKTRTALGELNQKLEEVIKLMLKMDMRQAEIFATTYAAWNNLLLDKQTPTDEQIVWAAREGWHPDKMKIDRDKFFKAIDWIRQQNICPQGKGKRVVPRPV